MSFMKMNLEIFNNITYTIQPNISYQMPTVTDKKISEYVREVTIVNIYGGPAYMDISVAANKC